MLSDFHGRLLPHNECREKVKVTPNGIDVERYFKEDGLGDGANDVGTFVYGSSPGRGLELLLVCWERIWERIRLRTGGQEAKLKIYYGFSDSFVRHGRMTRGAEVFDRWLIHMKGMLGALEGKGVEYVGMVDHETLTVGYADAGFVLYPTTYPETGCVTLMKAMASGAVPITSKFKQSTLPELTGGWDKGVDLDMFDEDLFGFSLGFSLGGGLASSA